MSSQCLVTLNNNKNVFVSQVFQCPAHVFFILLHFFLIKRKLDTVKASLEFLLCSWTASCYATNMLPKFQRCLHICMSVGELQNEVLVLLLKTCNNIPKKFNAVCCNSWQGKKYFLKLFSNKWSFFSSSGAMF